MFGGDMAKVLSLASIVLAKPCGSSINTRAGPALPGMVILKETVSISIDA